MKTYTVYKKENNNKVEIDSKKIEGYKLSPKNSFRYPGIPVDYLVLIKPTFIEKILKKKIKRKLNYYLKYIIDLIEETDDGTSFKEALDEISRYKDIIEYKYRKYLDDKYINILLKKITLLEHEIKSKSAMKTNVKPKITNPVYEEENELEEVRHRRR